MSSSPSLIGWLMPMDMPGNSRSSRDWKRCTKPALLSPPGQVS